MANTSQNVFKGLAIAAGAILAFNWLRKSSSASTLQFLPGSFKGIYFDGITPVLQIGIIVQNTSNQSYTLTSIAGSITANKYGKVVNIGNVSAFQQQNINANSQTTIWLNVRLSIIGVVTELISLFQQGIKQTVIFNGYANVENLQIPINFEYNIG